MLHTFRQKLGLVVGCCAGSLSVGLVLWVGTVWLPAALSSPPDARRNAPVTSSTGVPGQTAEDNPVYARNPDGRFIHPITGQPCPIGTKPAGRSGCVGYCPEQDMVYWEETGQCIPVADAKIACERKAGTWIVAADGREHRCRVPLTEIDPRERRRLERLGRGR
jgi:hypothetical protein